VPEFILSMLAVVRVSSRAEAIRPLKSLPPTAGRRPQRKRPRPVLNSRIDSSGDTP